MNSMTGFGRGTATGEDFEISVDIKTVNNRFLDVVLKLGGELQTLEAPLKKAGQFSARSGSCGRQYSI